MKLPRIAAGLFLGLAAGLLPAPGGLPAQPAEAAGEAELAPLWTALRRQSSVYRRAVLRFDCVEDVFTEDVKLESGASKRSKAATYRYLLESDPDRTAVAEYRETLTRDGVPVRSSSAQLETGVPPPFLWATLFHEENASLFRYEILGTEKRGVTDTVIIAFEGLLEYEDGYQLAEWSGRIWLDRDRLTPLHLEAGPARQEERLAIQLDRYRRSFRIIGLRTRSRPRAQSLSVDFLVSRFGLTFPSQSTWRQLALAATGERRTEKMMRRRFEEYRFIDVRMEETLGEPLENGAAEGDAGPGS
jgi:hypothetical protein